jgi:hypothetical protein
MQKSLVKPIEPFDVTFCDLNTLRGDIALSHDCPHDFRNFLVMPKVNARHAGYFSRIASVEKRQCRAADGAVNVPPISFTAKSIDVVLGHIEALWSFRRTQHMGPAGDVQMVVA